MSSNAGRIFELGNNGTTWQVIGDPNFLDGTYAPALTFGAPDPNSPDGVGTLNNFIYAGTVGGNIFVTQTGGGGGTRGGGGGGGGGGGVAEREPVDQHLHRSRRLGRDADRHRPDPGESRRLCRHPRRRLLTSATRSLRPEPDLDEHHRQPVHDPQLGIQQPQRSKRRRSAT